MKKSVCVSCRGVDAKGEPVLAEAITVTIELHQLQAGSNISTGPTDCPFNGGCHGQRCRASHPGQEKGAVEAFCPFTFDFPFCERIPGWKLPDELQDAMRAFGVSIQESLPILIASRLSPCHDASLYAVRISGVIFGICSECKKGVLRINPLSGEEEWQEAVPSERSKI